MHTIVTSKGHGLGWRKDSLDRRDLPYSAPHEMLTKLPPYIDLRHTGFAPPIVDQGDLGSCTANAIGGCVQYERIRQRLVGANRVPSRLMIYYDERELEGTVNIDAGAEIRDGIKAMAAQGACFEDDPDSWPYDVTKFAVKPPANCYTAALKDVAVQYSKIPQTIQQLKGCLASGFPFAFGFTVYPSFETDAVANTGRVPMPGPGEDPLGGHAVRAMGYDDNGRNFLVANSWGTGWGLHGYFLMPYEYLLRSDLSSDFWTIRLVSS